LKPCLVKHDQVVAKGNQEVKGWQDQTIQTHSKPKGQKSALW